MSDDAFDRLLEELGALDPNHPLVTGKQVGSLPDRKDRRTVRLPFPMGSLEKVKADDADAGKRLARWASVIEERPFVFTDKLDGISALLLVVFEKRGPTTRMFTRGDGTTGQDVSHILPHINNIPTFRQMEAAAEKEQRGSHGVVAVRGELVVPRPRFVSAYGENPDTAARNVVAGAVNALRSDVRTLALIDFVPYAVMQPRLPTSLHQLNFLKERLGFCGGEDYDKNPHTVFYETHSDELSPKKLCEVLERRRRNSLYPTDGIVVSNAFAFKSRAEDNVADTIVTSVTWTVSKDGFLKPVIEFEPVKLSGARIQRATAFNAEFVHANLIGPGAVVRITRSGDVIPHVLAVVAPAAQSQMPSSKWKWNGREAEVVLLPEKADEDAGEATRKRKSGAAAELEARRLTHFAQKMGVFGMSDGIVQALYREGVDTPGKLAELSEDDLERVPGFGKASAAKLHTALREALSDPDCVRLMEASAAFGRGFGERRLRAIMQRFPDALNSSPYAVDLVREIPGVSETTARAFLSGLDNFRAFLSSNGFKCNTRTVTRTRKNSQEGDDDNNNGPVVVFTGFRDTALEKSVEEDHGGRIASGVSKKVDFVVVPDDYDADENKTTSKIKTATQIGIPVISVSDFRKRIQKN